MKVLITGATDGLGRAVALALARRRGVTLLLHGRDERRGRELAAEVTDRAGSAGVSFYCADFSSLVSVREMAGRIAAEEDRLDVVLNNAGIGTTLPGDGVRMESADGYELRFQVNYLASFLLTRMLVPLLVDSAPARVVNVSSAGQMAIDFEDVMIVHGYTPVRAYRQSKLAQVMFTFDLADELAAQGVSATCLHPATLMPTKMVRHARATVSSTLEEGVAATLRLIREPSAEAVNGRYFNGLRAARADPQAYDPVARERLRELSQRLVGL